VNSAGKGKGKALPTADCQPIDVAPGLNRLFLDFCANDPAVRSFFPSLISSVDWQQRPPVSEHWAEIVAILAAQNPHAASAIEPLRNGAGTVVTGQQVGLFGGPLFTPFKAATAIARARQAGAAGRPHVAIFWLATEDHDFEEINNVTFPSRKELRRIVYASAPGSARPVGDIVLDDSITPLIEQAWELLGYSDAMETLAAAYKPGRTFARAFAEFYSKAFASQGLLVLDAGSREVHRLGSFVLRAAIEGADELHAALIERNRALEAAGYHAQVAVAPQSSLLFLLDDRTGARLALKRIGPSANEPSGSWHVGRQSYSTADLLGILNSEPERISPSALLRPVFQDFLLSTSLIIGGPAEVAYFAQSAVLYEKILGCTTPAEPRLSATLIEPAIGDLMRKHELTLDSIFANAPDTLAQLIAARAMPVEGKRKLAQTGNALDGELTGLVEWMHTLDADLGRSGETAARKMRYQMNRLRRLAANFQLQRETALARHAHAISRAIFPEGVPQERVHGAAYYFAHYGFELGELLTEQAADSCPGHKAIWL
jgi:bacillithiol biosynthesis cysteine-adding enzyme BshC